MLTVTKSKGIGDSRAEFVKETRGRNVQWGRLSVSETDLPSKKNRRLGIDTHALTTPESTAFSDATPELNEYKPALVVSKNQDSSSSTTSDGDSSPTMTTSTYTENDVRPGREERGDRDKTASKNGFRRTRSDTVQASSRAKVGTSKEAEKTSKNSNPSMSTTEGFIDPKKRYLKRTFAGRLGNVMFEFATAVCVALKNNLTLVLKEKLELSHFRYEGLIFPDHVFDKLPISPVRSHSAGSCCGFSEEIMRLEPVGSNHRLGGYTQSWKYFEPCKSQVQDAMLFTEDVVAKAQAVVGGLRKRFPRKTLVGVHVRMEDHTSRRASINGKRVAPGDYYVRAMTYFRNRSRRAVAFVVIASNPAWFRRNVASSAADVELLDRSESPAVDMEVLSRLDHIVISVGTFGWWAAYRSKGTVVVYRDFFRPGSHYGKQFWNNATDYIYPGWILM